jgi:hypothetical protein
MDLRRYELATDRSYRSMTDGSRSVHPDAKVDAAIDPGLGEALTVGRPIAAA